MGLTTTHDAWNGPYGAFDEMRAAFARAAGPIEPGDPLEVLTNLSVHTDASIRWQDCQRLGERLLGLIHGAGMEFQGSYVGLRASAYNFVDGLFRAAAKREPLIFDPSHAPGSLTPADECGMNLIRACAEYITQGPCEVSFTQAGRLWRLRIEPPEEFLRDNNVTDYAARSTGEAIELALLPLLGEARAAVRGRYEERYTVEIDVDAKTMDELDSIANAPTAWHAWRRSGMPLGELLSEAYKEGSRRVGFWWRRRRR